MHRLLIAFILFFPPIIFANTVLEQITQEEQNIKHTTTNSLQALAQLAHSGEMSKQPRLIQIRYYLLTTKMALTLSNFEEAIDQANIALELTGSLNEFNLQRLELQRLILQSLMANKQYELAIERAIKWGDSAKQNVHHQAEVLFIKAKLFDKLRRKSDALFTYKQSYKVALQSGDDNLLQKISLILAGRLLDVKDYQQAQQLLEKSNQYYVNNPLSIENLIVQIKLSDLAYSRHKLNHALSILIKAKGLAELVGSGLYRFVIELRIAELQIETNQITAAGVTLRHIEVLKQYLRRADDQDRLLLVQARYKVALNDYSGLQQLLKSNSRLRLTGSSKKDGRVLDLLQLKAKGLAAQGLFEQAYAILEQHQGDFATQSQRRNSYSLQRQKLMFDVELLEQKNKNLHDNNSKQVFEIKRQAEAKSQLLLLLLVLAIIAATAIVLAILLYRKRQQLSRLSYLDPLTGVYNRRYLSEIFPQYQKNYLNDHESLSGIMLDIDQFKHINDTYGHGVGDQVIIAFAQCCQHQLPANAVIIRLGGEEILALIPQWSSTKALEVADKLRIAISELEMVSDDGVSFNFTVSIGVANLSDEINDQHSLLRLVDQRLYIAKSEGRDRVVGESIIPKNNFEYAL